MLLLRHYFLLGVEAEEVPGVFQVVNESCPCFTEPHWSNIQTSTYSASTKTVGIVALVTGIVMTGFRYAYFANLIDQLYNNI